MIKKITKKVTKPILEQLQQGVTPHKLAQSIAFGIIFATIPILGIATLLCLLVAFIFKLNHIAIQTANYAAYPLQIIPLVRIGEVIYSRPHTPLNILVILDQFKTNIKVAVAKYFILGMMGVTAWAIIAPFAFVLIYFSSRWILIRVLKKHFQ